MRFSCLAALFSFLLVVPAAMAASEIPSDLNILRARQAEIRTGVQARSSGAYKELSQATRTELLTKQAELLALIDGKQNADELTEEQKAKVLVAVSWIDATLKEAGDERMVCERRAVLGSNRKERVCMTAAQMRAQREASREQMDRRGICADCGNR